jgi:hypothetical protein
MPARSDVTNARGTMNVILRSDKSILTTALGHRNVGELVLVDTLFEAVLTIDVTYN